MKEVSIKRGELLVYSMNIANNRVMVRCSIYKKKNMFRVMDAVYDTGAKNTCFSGSSLGIAFHEVKNNETKELGGFIIGNTTIVYKYIVENFYIGKINLGEQVVWLSYDENTTKPVVGMDILQQVTRLSIAGSGKECFFKDKGELMAYLLEKK